MAIKMLSSIKRLAGPYQNSSLRVKILIVYLLVIVLPFSLFVLALIDASIERAYEAHLYDGQQAMQQDVAGLSRRLTQLEGYAMMFQNDKRIVEYLNLQNATVADEILSFQTELYPRFAFARSLDGDILNMEIHFINEPLVPLPTHILYSEAYEETTYALPMGGEWSVLLMQKEDGAPDLTLRHQSPIYSADFFSRLGYLIIDARGQVLTEYLEQSSQDALRYVRIQGDWYEISGPKALAHPQGQALAYLAAYEETGVAPAGSISLHAGPLLINREPIPDLSMEYLTLVPQGTVANFQVFKGLLLGMLAGFVALSALYYAFLSTFTKRLIRLAAHIKATGYGNMAAFVDTAGGDEIGQVIAAHNSMIGRIGGLVSDLNIAKLKQDQARYYALQAQIRPHFLYNALETARMMAESNDDETTADFIYNLGIFIRNSFTTFDGDILLAREMDTVRKYLEIYKATMGSRLTYTVDVDETLLNVRCPPFVIQPLVENAIRHGLDAMNVNLRIDIRAYREGNRMVIAVQDDGVGMTAERMAALLAEPVDGELPAMVSEKGSVGIHNIRNRLYNYYGERAALCIHSAPQTGTHCSIIIEDPAEME